MSNTCSRTLLLLVSTAGIYCNASVPFLKSSFNHNNSFADKIIQVTSTDSEFKKHLNSDYPVGYPITDRTKVCINAHWKFKLGDADAKYYLKENDDKKWEDISLPHTLELTSIGLDGCKDDKTQPTFQRNVGWYRKTINIGNSDKRTVLYFEGAHQITTLWVNGKLVGTHKIGGYTPFEFDITDFITKSADNQITVLVDNRRSEVTPPDPGPFDYVKFSGLYRDVYLLQTNPVHITSNLESMNSGITITTPTVDYVNGNAIINIRSEVRNESDKPKSVTLEQRIVDSNGNVVLKLSDKAEITPGNNYHFNQIGGIQENVKFWSTEHPNLYKVNTTLYDSDGKAIDVVDNRLGIRKVEYNAKSGFYLNGKPIKLIGFNRHQHYAYIGDALPNSLHYKDMMQFKQWGFNCVRTAHYPQDDELIKACDELGILVYEEPPTWVSISSEHEWYENEMEAARRMVRNHKNSPSVIIWGGGINHRGSVAETNFVLKQEDPTRLTSSQSSRWSGPQDSGWADIFGNMMYGPGIWNRQEPLFAMEGHYGPEAVAPYMRDPMMPGLISWTAHAYYTFHDIGNWENRTRSGAMDAFRYPKSDDLYWYPSEFCKEPYMHIREDWNENLKNLTLYSNASEIELSVNDKLIGRYEPSLDSKYSGLSHPPFEIKNIKYEKGKLTVRGYRNGTKIIEQTIYTPEKANALRLIVDKYNRDFIADGNDILVVHAEVIDKNGTKIRDYQGDIKFNVKGNATIVGDGQNIGSNPVKVERGVGSVLIRAGFKPGNIQITALANGLKQSTLNVVTVANETDCMIRDAYVINDKEGVSIDLGGKGQLVQFGWTPVIGESENGVKFNITPSNLQNYVSGLIPPASQYTKCSTTPSADAYEFNIHPASQEGLMRWLGEMNVIGKNGFVYGDGVLCLDKEGLMIELKNLPKGHYTLKSYHHAPSSNTDSMDPNLEKLKKESIHKLPYSKTINAFVNGNKCDEIINVTSGKEQQFASPGLSEIQFNVNDKDDVTKVLFKSGDNNIGVWLNGLQLFNDSSNKN